MTNEDLPPNKELSDFLYGNFSVDPYNLSGMQSDIIEKYKPELVEESNLSSLGYVVEELISRLQDYIEKGQPRDRANAENLVLYLAHHLSGARSFTDRLSEKNEDVKELGEIFDKLYESHRTIGTEGQTDYTGFLKRVQEIKSTLGIDLSDRFAFGEKLGLKREKMITIFLRSGLESMTGYSFKNQNFYSERHPRQITFPRAIPSDDTSTRQMIKDAFSPDLPFDTTVALVRKLVTIAEETIRSNPTSRYGLGQNLIATNFMLSVVEKIMSR